MEKDNANRILLEASKLGVTLFRTNSGLAWQGSSKRFADINGKRSLILSNPRVIRLLPEGFFDYAGWTNDGKFVGIEVKSDNGRPSAKQVDFMRLASSKGCVVGIVRNESDLLDILRGLK